MSFIANRLSCLYLLYVKLCCSYFLSPLQTFCSPPLHNKWSCQDNNICITIMQSVILINILVADNFFLETIFFLPTFIPLILSPNFIALNTISKQMTFKFISSAWISFLHFEHPYPTVHSGSTKTSVRCFKVMFQSTSPSSLFSPTCFFHGLSPSQIGSSILPGYHMCGNM